MLVRKVTVSVRKPHKPKKLASAKKQGGQDHFTGKKNAWIEDKVPLFFKAQDAKRPGAFYTWVTREFIRAWGDDGSGDFSKEPDSTEAGDHRDGGTLGVNPEDIDRPGSGVNPEDIGRPDGGTLGVKPPEDINNNADDITRGAATQEEADAATVRFNDLRDVSIIYHIIIQH